MPRKLRLSIRHPQKKRSRSRAGSGIGHGRAKPRLLRSVMKRQLIRDQRDWQRRQSDALKQISYLVLDTKTTRNARLSGDLWPESIFRIRPIRMGWIFGHLGRGGGGEDAGKWVPV